LAIGALILAQSAFSQTKQRPIDDFVSTQGTFCIDDGAGGCLLFVPPDPNFVGWSTVLPDETGAFKLPVVRSRPAIPLFAGVDYAGVADAYAAGRDPVVTGTVTERRLSDGRAEVTVLLHTKNANVFVIDLDLSGDVLDQIANKPTLFGHRPRDVLAGAGQALADSLLHVRFINTAPGAPLPDLLQLNSFPDTLPGVELKFLAFNASATGPLTAAFGVAEGTPGKLTIVQTGLMTKGENPGRALKDLFPVEDIHLNAIGH